MEASSGSAHALPDEILIDVLGLAFCSVLEESPVNPRPMHQLQNLALVCRRWLLIIRCTPTFWTYLRMSLKAEQLRAMLPRAGDAPLTVDAPSNSGLGDREKARFWADLCRQIHRWKIAKMDIPRSHLSHFWNSLISPVSNLRCLHLVLDRSHYRIGTQPSQLLEKVSLLTGLEEISIKHWTTDAETVVHLLQCLPSLIRANFDTSLIWQHQDTGGLLVGIPVTLPRLKMLHLPITNHPQEVEYIMYQINAPVCVNLAMYIRLDEQAIQGFLPNSIVKHPFLASLRSTACPAGIVFPTSTDMIFEMVLRSTNVPPKQLRIIVANYFVDGMDSWISWFHAFFESSEIPIPFTFNFETCYDSADFRRIMPKLANLPRINALQIVGFYPEWMWLLSEAHQSSDGKTLWAFPEVSYIAIEDWYDGLQEMVRKRNRAADMSPLDTPSNAKYRPHRITKLRVFGKLPPRKLLSPDIEEILQNVADDDLQVDGTRRTAS